MIPPESKAKLEEMAKKYSEMREKDFYLAGNTPLTLIRINPTKLNAYREGATAAWKMATELAVKAERERIAAEIRRQRVIIDYDDETEWFIGAINLTPPKDEAEK